MPDADVRRLAEQFEIGGHTLDHLALTTLDGVQAPHQISGCKAWVEDVTGRPCTAFCPPLGRFAGEHLARIREAGFETVRTVELLSLDLPRHVAGLAILPTSVQAHPHGPMAYARNAIRRHSPSNLVRGVLHARGTDWVALCRRLRDVALQRGGVLHLWGHSWEIEENGQWGALEEALRILREISAPASRVTNSQLGRASYHRTERQAA
jgi:peptidoglycan/xylan/chitin deacetylase (PgdA/CDA1 family)